jgi:hypothetical protein
MYRLVLRNASSELTREHPVIKAVSRPRTLIAKGFPPVQKATSLGYLVACLSHSLRLVSSRLSAAPIACLLHTRLRPVR